MLFAESGLGPFRRCVRCAPVIESGAAITVTLTHPFYAFAGGGRVRSDAEVTAIGRRYAKSDWWRGLSSEQRLFQLRTARKACAWRDRKSESAVSRSDLIRHLGLRPADVTNGFWWQLAGDFVPVRRK